MKTVRRTFSAISIHQRKVMKSKSLQIFDKLHYRSNSVTDMQRNQDSKTKKKKDFAGTLYQELTCPDCGKLYTSPCLLPCEHSLCKSCLSKEIKSETNGLISINCPVCNEKFSFSREDEIKFPENYLLNNTVLRHRQETQNATPEMLKKKKGKVKGKAETQQVQVLCQLCDQKENRAAVKKCVNCNLNFCEKCLRKIHKNKAFQSHILIDPLGFSKDQIKCFFHPFMNLKHYCIQDRVPICEECMLSTHKDHPLYSLERAFQYETEELRNKVSEFKQVKENYEKCIQRLTAVKSETELNELQLNADVTDEFVLLQEALHAQEEAIKHMIRSEKLKKQNEVDDCVESASQLMLKLEGLILYTTEAFKETNPTALLQTSAQLNTRLSEAMLCVTPNESFPAIPFKDFELNVDSLKDAINALPLQMCARESNPLCHGDFQKVQPLNSVHKIPQMKTSNDREELFYGEGCPLSATSKAKATINLPNMNICSYVDHSCQCKPHYKLNSKTFNMDSCVYITPAAWSSPQSAYKNVTRDSSNGEPSEYITHERQCSPLRVSTANVDVGGCSHMTRSSQYNPPCVTEVDVASDPSNVYPYTYVTRSSQYSPQCMLVDVASNTTNVNTFGSVINSDQDNPPASLSKINAASNTSNLDSCLCVSQSSQYNLLCISKVEPASNTSNVNTLGSVINSNQYIGQCTSKMDAASNTPYMSSCGSALNSKLCNPHYNFEIQTVSSDCKKHSHPYQKCNIPKMCSSKPEKHISLNCSECICFQTHKPKNSHNWNTKLRTASETVPCHQAPSTPSECGCNGNVQESNACRGTSKATKSRQVPGIPQLVPTSQYHSQCHSKGNTSLGASGVDFSPKRPQSSSNIPSSKTEKCASECHDTVDLFTNKACTLSHTRQDSDTGIILDSKSSSLASVGEYGERIPGPYPLHCPDSIQSNNKHSIPCGLHDPCCYQHGDHPQCASSNSGACHIDSVKDKPCQFSNLTCLNTVKNISSSCFHTANFLNNPTSNNASSTNLRPHCTAANNPCCESPSLLPERDCCGNTAVSGQCHQKCSSDEPCIDPNKKETSCLPKKTFSTATDASFAYFDSAGNAKPWSLRNAPDGFCDTNAKHKTMEGSCLRKPRLFPKSKHQCNPKPPTAFMPKFAHSNPPQVQPVDQSKVNSDTSSSDSIKNKNYQLTKTPSSDSVKSNSSTRFDNIVFPQKWPFRTGHKISSLKPRSGIRIRAGHKPSVFTSKKNRGSRSFPSLSELRNLKLTCSIGKLQLFDSHIHFDEDIDPAQISSQTISTESTSTFEHELPEAPFIFKHTVDGTSAKVRWTFPMEEQSVNFFELQFQEIVSIDREMAIPQDQAGVFSGIRHNNFTATNLNSNSEYLFRVRAVNAAGKGEWSQPYKIVTVGGTEQCDPDTEDSASLKGVKVTIRRSSKNSLED